jgi:hypothetical protein
VDMEDDSDDQFDDDGLAFPPSPPHPSLHDQGST